MYQDIENSDYVPLTTIKDFAENNSIEKYRKMTHEIIEQMRKDNVPEDADYEIVHFFSTLKFDNLEKFAVEVNNKFDDEVTIFEPEELTDEQFGEVFFAVDVSIIYDCLDEAAITEDMISLINICNQYEIAYDGWSTGEDSDLSYNDYVKQILTDKE